MLSWSVVVAYNFFTIIFRCIETVRKRYRERAQRRFPYKQYNNDIV